MPDWILGHETMLQWIVAGSAVSFLASLLIVPWLIVRIPPDYFACRRRRTPPAAIRHPVARVALRAGKNALGSLLVVAGLAMLVLPGQGVLTILMGSMLMDIPGKYRFERWIVTRRPVLKSVNWLRRRAGRDPLVTEGYRPQPKSENRNPQSEGNPKTRIRKTAN